MPSDSLSDLLHLVEATSVISTGLKASGDWAIQVERHSGMKFNAIIEGNCALRVDGGQTFALVDGDRFLLTQGLPFVILSKTGLQPRAAREVFAGAQNHFARFDGGLGKPFVCIGGRMDAASDMNFLTSSLPPVVVLKAERPEASRVRWLLDRLMAELRGQRPGASVMSNQIMHMVMVEMIRACEETSEGISSWLAALSDPRIGRALRMVHAEPGRAWRLDDLASACNLSRSQFPSRFVALVGIPPFDYVLKWRMHVARRALKIPGSKVANVAADLGYQSEAAFGAAFKRVHGVSPRRSARPDAAVEIQGDEPTPHEAKRARTHTRV
ncbi:helix-turn-helix domain-containing protein [Sinorhizobium meliloti]|uniref:AraC family transcriptional regulator n=1 Tax=Rhizobium meliloti TaxID=382 RepID=UPI001294D605|nr:AraC family transcriptional regulator [Sinorhizobium meliloti]MQX38715.1 helix-turn-helix domain-containing protein [Sinorhizobium meliloti]